MRRRRAISGIAHPSVSTPRGQVRPVVITVNSSHGYRRASAVVTAGPAVRRLPGLHMQPRRAREQLPRAIYTRRCTRRPGRCRREGRHAAIGARHARSAGPSNGFRALLAAPGRGGPLVRRSGPRRRPDPDRRCGAGLRACAVVVRADGSAVPTGSAEALQLHRRMVRFVLGEPGRGRRSICLATACPR